MTTSNPYQAPNADVGSASTEPYQPKIFTAQGRIGRLRYLAYGFLSYLLLIPIFIVIGVVAAILGDGATEVVEILGGIIGVVAYIALFVYSFMLYKRRFNDLGQSGWLSLLLLVPIVNIVVWLFLLFAPGKPMTNQYGQPPSKNPVWVIICAVLFPILFFGILASVALPAYSDYVERAKQAEASYSE